MNPNSNGAPQNNRRPQGRPYRGHRPLDTRVKHASTLSGSAPLPGSSSASRPGSTFSHSPRSAQQNRSVRPFRGNRPTSNATRAGQQGEVRRTDGVGGAKATGGKRRRGRTGERMRKSMTQPPLHHRMAETDPKLPVIPPLPSADAIRVIPIAGVEEIGRNMIVVETADDIVVFDAGLQFVSEESNAPGVNYILPNTKYLEDRVHKIRALVVTHGHLDHTGGIPFIMERIGNPPIYTQYLTSLMIAKRQEEFPHLPTIDMHVVKEGESFTVGKMTIKTFPVTHSIPDAMGVSVITKFGNIVITGDIKLAHVDGKPLEDEVAAWGSVGKDKNVLMVADSTNAEREGFSAPEANVHANIEEIVRNATGRLIIGTFASQFERLINVILSCERMGKKIVTEGRSIKVNIEIAQLAGLLTVQKGTIISSTEIDNYPADRVVILSTGAQGEEFAALMRIATGKHKSIRLTERDTVVFSSSVVPGNEISVQKLKDNIYRTGAKVIHYRTANAVHSTGHGNIGELIWIQQQVRPKFFMPVHGHHSMLRCHANAAVENGFPKANIVIPDNGTILDITGENTFIVQKEKAPSEDIFVDGFSVGAKQEVVIRDRQSLANDGMFVIIATVNVKTGRLRKSPDIISRGFVYLRESQQLLSEARILIKRTVEKHTENMNPLNLDYVKDELTETVSAFLMQKTNKTPMVIPVLIGI